MTAFAASSNDAPVFDGTQSQVHVGVLGGPGPGHDAAGSSLVPPRPPQTLYPARTRLRVTALEQVLHDRLPVHGPGHPDTLATRHHIAYWS
jgi:hypothetical protein